MVIAFSHIVTEKTERIMLNKGADAATKALAGAANATVQGIQNAVSGTGDAIKETIRQGVQAASTTAH